MKMANFVKLRLAVAKVLDSLTKINAVHVFPSSNVLVVLIIQLEHVTVKSVQGASMTFLRSELSLNARSHLTKNAAQNMATVKVRISQVTLLCVKIQLTLHHPRFQLRWLPFQCRMR